MIQIVYETLKDQQEGKKGRASVKSGGASESNLWLFCFWLYLLFICFEQIDTGLVVTYLKRKCNTKNKFIFPKFSTHGRWIPMTAAQPLVSVDSSPFSRSHYTSSLIWWCTPSSWLLSSFLNHHILFCLASHRSRWIVLPKQGIQRVARLSLHKRRHQRFVLVRFDSKQSQFSGQLVQRTTLYWFFLFISREILLWGGLSRPRSVSHWLVHQPGRLGLG